MRWVYIFLIGLVMVESVALGATASTFALPTTNNSNYLLIPVAGTSASQLRDTFNEGRGTMHRHEAIDILAPMGTHVFAVADGKIVKLFNSKKGGLTIYQFDTNEKLTFYYAHLNGYATNVKEGL